jgi:hypothetical protein
MAEYPRRTLAPRILRDQRELVQKKIVAAAIHPQTVNSLCHTMQTLRHQLQLVQKKIFWLRWQRDGAVSHGSSRRKIATNTRCATMQL